jgi:hypothetical protein
MAEIKRNGLTARIPRDVVERARKAGVHDVDWYAGRLEEGDSFHVISSSSSGSIDAKHKQALRRHRDRSGASHRSPVTMFAALWTRAVRHTPHSPG